ncbi:RagB/SusD family nutrient uptake outer membrane protein [Zobellia galactanivorans]|uniref:RagB/SusD family nutrient uptake outer membrane protein n=1 Tax=Zobellia galactanivorans (strain DSM 12802 / CCUG 47099 / CIP 106680 / NCIMB 13871 / Dsij) TaxID=63186 RepID=UPI001C066C3D|nr:RagB/SusD family nutrient uptake outer membrane protein [Zobellia galactanivorans]MBU3025251.1 RagB/SusD family nutrient uptake outer membrane protein [Zobellia galactanivorans]
MKNITYLTGLMMSLALCLTSCEGDLEENPAGNISIANFYSSEDDAVAGLYGVYNSVYSLYGNTAINYGEVNADNATVSPNVSDLFEWDEFTYSNEVTEGFWRSAYDGINLANEVALYTAEIDFDEEKRADIVSEAKALRALFYWHLVRTMGGVPIYETPTIGFDAVDTPRATADEVYSLITRDLGEAALELPETSLAGRLNAHIADALLARIYLYRNDFENALVHAKRVIDSGAYDLFDDYAHVFKTEHNNGIEHIYQIQYLSGERNNPIPGSFGPRALPGPYGNSFWANTVVGGSIAPSTEFTDDNPISYRRSVTIADSYEHIDGVTGTITMEEAYGPGVYPFYVSKFDDRASELQSGANFNVIRFADVLLIAAEAINEVDPADNNKYTWVNRVRKRARNGVETDLPDLSGLSQDDFRTAVLEERRFELAFEGQRAWDLKRRGEFLTVMRAQGKNVEDYKLLFPIPNNQVRLNPNLTQNEGW